MKEEGITSLTLLRGSLGREREESGRPATSRGRGEALNHKSKQKTEAPSRATKEEFRGCRQTAVRPGGVQDPEVLSQSASSDPLRPGHAHQRAGALTQPPALVPSARARARRRPRRCKDGRSGWPWGRGCRGKCQIR